jgi:hypothetical protein
LPLCASHLPLGVPNGRVNYTHQSSAFVLLFVNTVVFSLSPLVMKIRSLVDRLEKKNFLRNNYCTKDIGIFLFWVRPASSCLWYADIHLAVFYFCLPYLCSPFDLVYVCRDGEVGKWEGRGHQGGGRAGALDMGRQGHGKEGGEGGLQCSNHISNMTRVYRDLTIDYLKMFQQLPLL